MWLFFLILLVSRVIKFYLLTLNVNFCARICHPYIFRYMTNILLMLSPLGIGILCVNVQYELVIAVCFVVFCVRYLLVPCISLCEV